MKYRDEYTGTKAEFGDYLKKLIPDLFASRLAVEGNTVAIPSDKTLTYNVKYNDEDGAGGSVTIKVCWENITEDDVEVNIE